MKAFCQVKQRHPFVWGFNPDENKPGQFLVEKRKEQLNTMALPAVRQGPFYIEKTKGRLIIGLPQV